jgi:glycosyltransferase involved in cell wall biosynthesis
VKTMAGLRIVLVGPVPPPSGGMANQTRALAELLAAEGASVRLVASNPDVRPAWLHRVRGARGLWRSVGLSMQLRRALRTADIVHVMANSGWSWHLIAAPAVWLASARGVPAIVHYHGGEAAAFLARSGPIIRITMSRAGAVVVPSAFLRDVFARHGIETLVIANVVDLARFVRRPLRAVTQPRVLVARNLEPVYDVAAALRAFACVHDELPEARLTIAGSGPERDALIALRDSLGLADVVDFCGRLDMDAMATALKAARVSLNPSLADNMPVSVLEAMATGVPVVSTRVGGIPWMVRDGETALLVDAGDHRGMARALLRLLRDDALAARLADAAAADVQQYAWPRLRALWMDLYDQARGRNGPAKCPA